MSDAREDALIELAEALDRERIRYMVIGASAVMIWGRPRATLDVDATIWVDDERVPDLLARLQTKFKSRVKNWRRLFERTRMLLLETQGAIGIDLSVALIPYEEEALARAKRVRLRGQSVKFCTPEDLVILKLMAGRPKDLEDVKSVLDRQGKKLDRRYIASRLEALSAATDQPEALDRWRAAQKREK